jgi:hypothetical protein
MSRNRPFQQKLFQKWTAVFFVLVMAGFGFVQAVHVHDAVAGENTPATHCSLCVVAHSAAVTAPVTTAPSPVIGIATIVLSDPQLLSRLQVGTSFIRPPPASL